MIEIHVAILAWLLCLSERPPQLWNVPPSCHPLHDVVWLNCRKGAAIENQGTGAKYMAKCLVYIIVPSILLSICVHNQT